MSTVFLAPTLQPVTQSPQRVQAGCSRPAALGPAVNVTFTGGRTKAAPSSSADARSAACLGSGGSVSGYGVEPSISTALRKPALRAASGSPRNALGQVVSWNTRGSASRATLALISDVPPRPQPISTPTSSENRKSNRPAREPTSWRSVWAWTSRRAPSVVLGYCPGWISRPRSRTATVIPARARRQARTPPPYPEPTTTTS